MKLDSELSRTALTLTQRCPGPRSAWLSAVPDNPQPDSALSDLIQDKMQTLLRIENCLVSEKGGLIKWNCQKQLETL